MLFQNGSVRRWQALAGGLRSPGDRSWRAFAFAGSRTWHGRLVRRVG
ncbi:hypothetical protein [Micromonospora sp. ATA51]|nr:hypothetical protein [Micromonospora sp. ATA51]MBM0224938.1 hypothetical protein [Micromonospora sp. ATA51]